MEKKKEKFFGIRWSVLVRRHTDQTRYVRQMGDSLREHGETEEHNTNAPTEALWPNKKIPTRHNGKQAKATRGKLKATGRHN